MSPRDIEVKVKETVMLAGLIVASVIGFFVLLFMLCFGLASL